MRAIFKRGRLADEACGPRGEGLRQFSPCHCDKVKREAPVLDSTVAGMKTQHALILILAAAAGISEAAAAELVPLEWTLDGRFVHEATIPGTKFLEVCGKLPAGARIVWDFDANSALDFNIHFHEGKKVQFPAKHDKVEKAHGTLDAKVEQDYCWMWTNKAARATALKLTLKRS